MPATIAAVAAPAAPAAPSTPSNGASGAETPSHPTSGGAEAKAPVTKPGETAAEKAQRLKFKAKVDGKEEEVDWDEAEAARTYQKAKHYEKTRGEFDAKQRAHEQQLAEIQKDPIAFFKQRGVDLTELGRQQAAQEAELAALDPQARRIAEQEARIKEFETREAKRAEAETAAKEQAEHQQLVQTTTRTIGEAMKLSGMKPNGELMRLYTDVLKMAEHAGEPPLSPQQLVVAGERLRSRRLTPLIKTSLADPAWRAQNVATVKELAGALVGSLEGPQLVELLGKDAVRRITRESLAAFRKSPLPSVTEMAPDSPVAQPPARQQNGQEQHVGVLGILDRMPR